MKSVYGKSMRHKFLKYAEGAKGAQLFESLPRKKRAELRWKFVLDHDEDPILIASLKPQGVLILTVRRAVFDSPTGPKSFPYPLIASVGVDLHAELAARRAKALWQTLKLEPTSGKSLRLELEPGKSFWAVLNVFVCLVRRRTED